MYAVGYVHSYKLQTYYPLVKTASLVEKLDDENCDLFYKLTKLKNMENIEKH